MDQFDSEWETYRANFSEIYDEANYSGSFQSWVMGRSHDEIEKFHGKDFFTIGFWRWGLELVRIIHI